jgi:large conductance mechanosensitive channel
MTMLKEFRDFAVKGNVADMAIGIIIGGAFGKIVSSLVADVIMPPLGMLIGQVDFTDLAVTLKAAEGAAPAVLLKYGVFLQTTFDFIIVAFAMFLVVKAMNRLKRQEAAAAPAAPSEEIVLLTQIRDALRK